MAGLVLPLVLIGPALLPGRILGGADWTDLLYPLMAFTREMLAATGSLPFWNPRIFSGMPHLASLNVLALYPTELASLALPVSPPTFYAADLLAHFGLAAAGAAWWAQRTGVGGGGALAAGLAYALGGHALTLAGAGHPHWVRCLALLPWMMGALDHARDAGSRRAALAAGALLGICALGGAMQFAALAAPVSAFWLAGGGPLPFRHRLALLALFACAAGGMGAALLLPGLEYYGESVRAVAEPGRAGAWSLSPWEIPGWVVAGAWGTPGNWFGPHAFRSSNDYAGPLAVVLAAVGAARPRDAHVRRLLWLAAASVLLALGPWTPAGRALAALPVYGGFRAPLRWLSFAHLALAQLMARGTDAVLARSGQRVARRGMAACLALMVACATGYAAAGWMGRAAADLPFVAEHLAEGGRGRGELTAVLGRAMAGGTLRAGAAGVALGCAAASTGLVLPAFALGAVGTADWLSAAAPFVGVVPAVPSDPVGEEVARRTEAPGPPFRIVSTEDAGAANRRMAAGREYTWGYHGLPLGRYARFYAGAVASPAAASWSLLNVRWLVAAGEQEDGLRPAAVIGLAPGASASLYLNPAAWPRAWLAAAPVPCPTPGAAWDAMQAPGWTPARAPVEGPLPPLATPGHGDIACAFGPDALRATVRVTQPGLVVFSEIWYPAWKAWVDGRRVPLLRAYGCLRAVAVPGGGHAVTMRYDSWTAKVGAWLTLLTVAALAGLAVPGHRGMRAAAA